MNYLQTQANVDKILAKFGQTVVITSQVAGSYNTATGTLNNSSSTQTTNGAVFSWGSVTHPSYGMDWVNAGLIQSQDQMLLLSIKNITAPKLGDIVTLQGNQYTIVAPLKIESPAGIPLFIVCNIRR